MQEPLPRLHECTSTPLRSAFIFAYFDYGTFLEGSRYSPPVFQAEKTFLRWVTCSLAYRKKLCSFHAARKH